MKLRKILERLVYGQMFYSTFSDTMIIITIFIEYYLYISTNRQDISVFDYFFKGKSQENYKPAPYASIPNLFMQEALKFETVVKLISLC